MASLIDNLLRKKASSADHAKERLHLVLINDRTDLSQEDLESLKDRLIQVISDYVMIDPSQTEIQIQTSGREQTLIAHIPLRNSRNKK